MQSGNEKILGGLGSIFIVLSFIPGIGELLGIVGAILLFIAIYKLSQVSADKNIFNKFLTGFLISIVGIILAVILAAIVGIGAGFSIFSLFNNDNGGILGLGLGLGLGAISLILFLYIAVIVGMHFQRQCFNIISQYTGINLFKLAGNFMFWGAVGLIAFGLGAIAIYVGYILLAIAFFNLPDYYGKKTDTP